MQWSAYFPLPFPSPRRCRVSWMLALGLDDGRVMKVDEATGEEKWANQAHDGQNCQARVAMSPNHGRVVASVGLYEQRFKLWDEASGAVHELGPFLVNSHFPPSFARKNGLHSSLDLIHLKGLSVPNMCRH